MSIQEQYESKTGEKATYRIGASDYHTLRYVRWLESRLREEIKYGHRGCSPDCCKASGVDCPARQIWK